MLIDDLFDGQMDEEAILRKHNITRDIYYKWLNEDNFKEQFRQRMDR